MSRTYDPWDNWGSSGDDEDIYGEPAYTDGGGGDPYGLDGLPTGGGQAYNPFYGNFAGGGSQYFNAPPPTFSTTVNGSPIPFSGSSQGGSIWGPVIAPGGGGEGGGSSAPPIGAPGSQSSTTNNTQNNASQLNVASESQSNALPPIAEGTPAGNDSSFAGQYIPQSQRRMNPAGMDSGARMPSAIPRPSPPLADYDPGLSKAGTGIPSGNPQPIPTQESPSFGHRALGALEELTGVNRYKKMVQDVRRKPQPGVSNATPPIAGSVPAPAQRQFRPQYLGQQDPNDPYGI